MRIVAILLSANVVCLGQAYPRWFTDPIDLRCGLTACGYADAYYNRSSSDSAAYADACLSFAFARYVKIEGGEAYWATEAGMYWMGNDITETTDSAYRFEGRSKFRRLAGFFGKEMTVVLLSDGDCAIPASMKELSELPRERPVWVDSLPADAGYIYAAGIAPEYYYQSSSWRSAEKRARFNLARNTRTRVESLTKRDQFSGQDIRNNEVYAELRAIEVVHRWRDPVLGIYYVLVRVRV